MKTSFLLTMVVFLTAECNHTVQCQPNRSATSGNETDHTALLALKASLVGGGAGSDSAPLSSWNASSPFCQWEGVTCQGRHLRVTALDLVQRSTGGFISPFIGNLTFLRIINLSGNNLKGFIPEAIGLLSRLEVFNVSFNALEGGFPLQLTNCTRLLTMDLYSNGLSGIIPGQLASMPKLQYLSVGPNNFTGKVPSFLGNISSLRGLDLQKNRLQGGIPSNLGKLKSLNWLSLNGNYLSGTIPPSLYNLTSLSVLSLVNNHLSGTVKPSMGVDLPHLRLAFLGMNNFTGVIPPTLSNISGLQKFDVSQNHFYGNVPRGLGRLMDLEMFAIQKNNIGSGNEGDLDFITSLTNLTDFKILSIHNNRLGGMIPSSIGNLSAGKIEGLGFGFNMISGHIPVGIGNLVGLFGLGIEGNNLIGEVPSSIGNLDMLQSLSLGGNRLQGTIPSSLGNLKNLYGLGLERNQLEGTLPSTLQSCDSLRLLYLFGNRLSGTISAETIKGLNQLSTLDLSYNFFTGSFPAEVGKMVNLNSLDISNNNFSGEIPTELGRCSVLEILQVQENFFQGRIPSSLGSLKGARYMDLSGNNLSGEIPSELQDLRFLQVLNISFNQLEGEVPTKGIFNNLTRFSFQGNERLCGGIPELHLPNCSTKNQSKNDTRRTMSVVVIIAITVSIFFGLVLAAILTWVAGRKVSERTPPAAVSFLDGGQYLRLSYKQLSDATDQFSAANLIGVGSFGSVYSGVFNDGPIAVKMMNLEKRGAIKSFKAECKALSKVRHRNLLQILSCCSSLDFKGNDFLALVYQLMPNGSLESWLHGSKFLTLGRRLDIAIDIASALEYLHHDSEQQIVHCDLKPSNVLLDGDMVARVGDFGLAKILGGAGNLSQEQSISSFSIKGTVGYVPPEYGMGGAVSIQGDMYSYGILLLEMVTGRRPTDEIFKDNTSLHNFCKSKATNSDILDIVDSRLLAELNTKNVISGTSDEIMNVEKMQGCAQALAEVGIACSVESSNERMDIREALKVLHKTKTEFVERRIGVNRLNVTV